MATFAIDPAHTDVLFSAKHMMVTNVRGTFTDVSGSIDIDETEPTASTADITVRAASVDTGFAARDTHLRSDDFFAVETFPEIHVVSTKIQPKGSNDFVVTADVTIKDVTRPVTLDLEYLGTVASPWGDQRAGFSASTEISRKDWGLGWNLALEAGGVVVGDKVKLNIEAEAILQQ